MNLVGVENNVVSVGTRRRLLKALELPQEMNTPRLQRKQQPSQNPLWPLPMQEINLRLQWALLPARSAGVIALQWLPGKISIPEVNPKVNMFTWATKVHRRVGRPRETASLGLGSSEVSSHSERGHWVHACDHAGDC